MKQLKYYIALPSLSTDGDLKPVLKSAQPDMERCISLLNIGALFRSKYKVFNNPRWSQRYKHARLNRVVCECSSLI